MEEIKGKKKKRKSKKVPQDDVKRYGAYFNYLPFEQAVIESKGKTPYNNQQVEMIANQGFEKAAKAGYWSPSTIAKEGQKEKKKKG